ncbi:PIG-L family deacetylase [Nonomuraea sp. NPDC047529]|uniref:PIG-L deacetylase family protein n=1 Tax=Nonomuraea sp. NPDC047529 TaxID=3155623 RepID=UPI0033FB78A6
MPDADAAPPRVAVVSPHLDDAVLSIGASIADWTSRGAEVRVITAFAGDAPSLLSPVARAYHDSSGLGADAMATRRAEDEAAAAAVGASTCHLPFPDAVYRRREDGSWLCDGMRSMFDSRLPEDGRLGPDLANAITEHCRGDAAPHVLVTCAGFGGHVDHRLTRRAVLAAARATGLPAMLWEDLPYMLGSRRRGIAGSAWPYAAAPAAWEHKWRAVEAYGSQLRLHWHDDRWRTQLHEHAVDRGDGVAVELFWPEAAGAAEGTDRPPPWLRQRDDRPR